MRSILKACFWLISWAQIGDNVMLLPFEKRTRLQQIVAYFKPQAFVETGSYHGETCEFIAPMVQKVISIEIDHRNCLEAQTRCETLKNVQILNGDSAELLREILQKLSGKVLFWLDAHYQVGMVKGKAKCPIFAELNTIFAAKNIEPIIVVDDARKFIWVNGWPSLASLRRYVQRNAPGFGFRVSHDMILIGKFEM